MVCADEEEALELIFVHADKLPSTSATRVGPWVCRRRIQLRISIWCWLSRAGFDLGALFAQLDVNGDGFVDARESRELVRAGALSVPAR